MSYEREPGGMSTYRPEAVGTFAEGDGISTAMVRDEDASWVPLADVFLGLTLGRFFRWAATPTPPVEPGDAAYLPPSTSRAPQRARRDGGGICHVPWRPRVGKRVIALVEGEEKKGTIVRDDPPPEPTFIRLDDGRLLSNCIYRDEQTGRR